MTVELFTDGGARGNPGPAAIGGLARAGELLFEFSEPIGVATNNQAEYLALIHGLEELKSRGQQEITAHLDSELIVHQLSGRYRVKEPHLKPLHAKVLALQTHFQKLTFTHVPRAQNARADLLVNEALDR